jgi:DNA-binding CsgD family transcriptional regulator
MLDEVLVLARSRGDRAMTARVLVALGNLSGQSGDSKLAYDRHQEALLLRHGLDDRAGLADSLEAIGGLAASAGRWVDAARLVGVGQSFRNAVGCVRVGGRQRDHDAIAVAIAGALTPEGFEAAAAQGAAMSAAEAVSYALKGRGAQRRPKVGWESLTRAEQGVAALVAEGLTNSQIAERIFVTKSTVEGHLSHIFSKLGLESRAQLVRESVRRAMTLEA